MERKTQPQLVFIADDGELRATTTSIADGMHIDHESTIKLVRKYLSQLKKFGRVGFEIQSFDTPGGRQRREVAQLNEPQAALLISFMRNTARVVNFKVGLVAEFFRMRSALQQRDMTLWQRRLHLEARDRESFEWASFGAHKMRDRQRDLPAFDQERADLDAAMQQPIPGMAPAPHLRVVGRKRAASNDSKRMRRA